MQLSKESYNEKVLKSHESNCIIVGLLNINLHIIHIHSLSNTPHMFEKLA